MGPYPLAPAPFGPSQQISDPRELAAVELVLPELVDSRPRRLSTPIPAIEKLAARNYVQLAKHMVNSLLQEIMGLESAHKNTGAVVD